MGLTEPQYALLGIAVNPSFSYLDEAIWNKTEKVASKASIRYPGAIVEEGYPSVIRGHIFYVKKSLGDQLCIAIAEVLIWKVNHQLATIEVGYFVRHLEILTLIPTGT